MVSGEAGLASALVDLAFEPQQPGALAAFASETALAGAEVTAGDAIGAAPELAVKEA